MTTLTGFPPVLPDQARVLILGSMPGAASLQAGEYYAHPRNAFWPLMDSLIGAGPALPYAQRLDRLRAQGIALWDVLRQCERPGSLDADIVGDSQIANDFPPLFAGHPGLTHVLCNGTTAEHLFRRQVMPRLDASCRTRLTVLRLPSTSPAHASLRLADKLACWQAALTPLLPSPRTAA